MIVTYRMDGIMKSDFVAYRNELSKITRLSAANYCSILSCFLPRSAEKRTSVLSRSYGMNYEIPTLNRCKCDNSLLINKINPSAVQYRDGSPLTLTSTVKAYRSNTLQN